MYGTPNDIYKMQQKDIRRYLIISQYTQERTDGKSKGCNTPLPHSTVMII